MAKPVITWKSSNYVTTAGPTYTASPTWTPAANSLLVALVVGCSASPSDPTGVTGHGQTYSKVVLPTATLSTTHIMSVWVANAGASPSSVAEVASFDGTPTGDALICFEITGWESDELPINAFGTSINTGTGSGTTGTVTLSLRPDVTSEHVNLSFWLHLANEATTPRTNWTETAGADGNFNSPATGAEAQFRTDVFELTNTATWTGNVSWRGLGLVVRGTATTPIENVRVSDQITVALTPLPVTVPAENVKVTDGPPTVTRSDPPITASITENLKVDDSGQGATQLVGPIRVQDGPPVATLVEPGQGDLTTGELTENLRVSESPSTTLNPLERLASESIRVTETPATTLNPLERSLSESIKVTDSAAGTEDPLQATPQENVKVQDTLTVDPFGLVIELTENIVVQDAGESYAELSYDEFITVSDVLGVALDLAVTLQEALKVSDTVTADFGPLTASLNENLKVTDSLTPTLNPLATTLTDAVRVADAVTVTENPLLASPQEVVKVSDIQGAQIALSDVTLTESIKVSDTASVLLNPEQAQPTDSIKVSDQISASLSVLNTSVQESVKVADTIQPGLELVRSVTAESVKVADVLTAQLATLVPAAGDESVRVTDSVQASLGSLVIALTESVVVQDSAQASSGLLEVSLTEDIRVDDDTISTHPAVADYAIHVRQRVTGIHVVPRETGVHVRPRVTTIKVKP